MKGLLLKDWYSSWKENKVVFVVVAAFLAVQTINGSFIFAMMAPIMITSLGTAIFTRDEYSGWLQFARTLPLSGRQIIGERYLFILLLNNTCQLVCTLCSFHPSQTVAHSRPGSCYLIVQ